MSGDKKAQKKAPAAKKEEAAASPAKESPKPKDTKKPAAAEQPKDSPKKAEAAKKPAAAAQPAKESPKKAPAAKKPAEAKKPVAAAAAPKKATGGKKVKVPGVIETPAPAKKAATSQLVTATKPALPSVPASILRKRKLSAERVAEERKKVEEGRKKRKETKDAIVKRAEKYVAEYRQLDRSVVQARRDAKNSGNFYLEAEPKVALVIRIRGTQGLAPKPRKILQLLRLRQINNAVLVKLNKAMINMLRIIDPYITWGSPSLTVVRNLVYKRGYGKVNGQRIPLSSNTIIQEKLGSKDIICMEDLVHELYTAGPNFRDASNFLWPFKLNPPRGGYSNTLKHVNEGGDFGYRADTITALAHKMI